MSKYLAVFFIINLLCHNAWASYSDHVSASSQALGIGGQGNIVSANANTNFYLPAALQKGHKIQFELNTFATTYNLKPIRNIVIENSVNTENGEEKIGDISNDYENLYFSTLHLSLPIRDINGSINLSVLSPFPYLAYFDTGDPHTPEYALIKARTRRPQGQLNFAYSLSEDFSFSIGAHIGAKVDSQIFTKAAVNNEGETVLYSFASASGEVTPQISPIISFFYKNNNSYFGLYYQHELETGLKVDLTADEISTGIIFDSIIESVLYYDPPLYRFIYNQKLSESFTFFSTIEYQVWKSYQTPKIEITQLAIMTGSNDFEVLSLKNTISPRLGIQYQLSDSFNLKFGVAYKQSPFTGDFSGAGNTIHSDSYTISLAPEYQFNYLDKEFTTNLAVSYEAFENMNVTKSSGQENGQSGRKIGAPGYAIGGNFMTVSLGVNVRL